MTSAKLGDVADDVDADVSVDLDTGIIDFSQIFSDSSIQLPVLVTINFKVMLNTIGLISKEQTTNALLGSCGDLQFTKIDELLTIASQDHGNLIIEMNPWIIEYNGRRFYETSSTQCETVFPMTL